MVGLWGVLQLPLGTQFRAAKSVPSRKKRADKMLENVAS